MFERAGTDLKGAIMITSMNRIANILSKPYSKIYFDFKFDFSQSRYILSNILKKDSTIIWDNEITLSSKGPFQSIYWLSFNESNVDTKGMSKLINSKHFSPETDMHRLSKFCARFIKKFKKGDKIIITKEENNFQIAHYTIKYLIVKETSLDAKSAEIRTEDLEILESAKEMYLLTWNKKVLRHYVNIIFNSSLKIKKIFCKEIDGIYDCIFFGILLNILPLSTINVTNFPVYNWSKQRIAFQKKIAIGPSNATISLNKKK